MGYSQAFIKDSLKRIEAKLDQLLTEKPNTGSNVVSEAQPMTAAERMAHARSFKKDVNTGEEGRG